MAYKKLTRNQHFETAGPKRILALDGGGLRGIVTLESLTEMDEPKNMPLLKELADLDAEGIVDGNHFPEAFDLS